MGLAQLWQGAIGRWLLGLGMTSLGVAGVPLVALAQSAPSPPPSLNDVRFRCTVIDGEYVVVYSPESEPDTEYPWAQPTALGGGWTPERRCNEISRRLESYRPDGLQELQTGVENGYDIVCVTTEQVPGCRIVLTVPPGQDPVATRDRVFENIVVADSGQQTDAVVTFGEDGAELLDELGNLLGFPRRPSHSGPINLRPFLDPADGGTGEFLNSTPSTPRRLDPDRFR